VEFSTEAAFRSEYLSNIANGGIFVATRDELSVRDLVLVELRLSYCDRTVELEGEVVHCLPAEMADAGASPGVAVQFRLPARELRSEFEPIVGVVEGNERISRSGRRAAPRAPARITVTLRSESQGEVVCRTRDISSSGLLVSLSSDAIAIGEPVTLLISHPQSGEVMDVEGTVVRHLEKEDGTVTAMGIEFHTPEARQTEVSAFMNDVRAAEHSRRLGGITGPIAELGIENLLQMFGSSSPEGTLTVTRECEEGIIAFEGGNLRAARLGAYGRSEALKVMLSWREGSFEFQARIEESELDPDSVPLNGAILDALCELDESSRAGHDDGGLAALSDGDISAEFDLDDELDMAFDDPDDHSDAGLDDDASEEPLIEFTVDGLDDEDADDEDGTDYESDAGLGDDDEDDEPVLELTLDLDEEALQGEEEELFDDEGPAAGTQSILPGTEFEVDVAAADSMRTELDKTEEAVLDLALVGFSVERIVEVIPEPELEIYGALDSLIGRGLIRSS
jgi:Tfp pilus assembly protein PilZ